MKQFLLAFVVTATAPSAAVLLFAVGQFALGVPHIDTVNNAVNLLAVSLPVAAALGIPTHFLLMRLRWTSLGAYALAGIWIGAGGWCALVLPFDVPSHTIWMLLALWIIAGMLCASLFWSLGVAHRRRDDRDLA